MILITGASGGVGKYLYEYYTGLGEQVVGTYHQAGNFQNQQGYHQLDLTHYDHVAAFVQQHVALWQNITLVNCAGITYSAFAHKAQAEQWHRVIDVNIKGTFNIIREVLPIMRSQKFGRIINFSSVVALKPTPGVSAYAATKAALWGMARSIATENASLNVTINNINLGYSELGMINTVPEQYMQNILAQIPMGRLCPGQDIISTVEYLRHTPYITGTSVDLNGGLQ
jgi:NAD(P)-dependent dehydrogenase (short-subunit alcohol dehydrogenase family)